MPSICQPKSSGRGTRAGHVSGDLVDRGRIGEAHRSPPGRLPQGQVMPVADPDVQFLLGVSRKRGTCRGERKGARERSSTDLHAPLLSAGLRVRAVGYYR
jgi:hypothetical protein